MRHFIFTIQTKLAQAVSSKVFSMLRLAQAVSSKVFSFLWTRIRFVSTQNNKAFSLLEMLVALTLFAFLFLYITQLVRQNYRYVRKIKENLKSTDSIYHINNLIKQDLSSVTYFLDISYNFRTHFPFSNSLEDESQAQNRRLTSKVSPFQNSVLIDPQIVFQATSKEMKFISYTFSKDQPFKQWIKIRYVVESCPSGQSSGLCLMRYKKTDWNRSLIDREEWEEPALVIKDRLESMSFSYSDTYSLTKPEWQEEWKVKKRRFNSSSSQQGEESYYITLTRKTAWPEELPLPSRVLISFKKTDSPEERWVFPVSDIRLKEWSSFSKKYQAFPKWSPPKPEKKPEQKRKPK